MKTNLDYWENQCSIEKFKSWCHTDAPWKSMIIEKLIKLKPISVLDVGCGTAHMGEMFRALNLKVKYKGVERTPKFVEYNKKNGFDCSYGDVQSLKVEDSSYECVLCLDVLNYCLDPKPALEELSRVSSDKVVLSFFKTWGTGEITKRKDGSGLCENFFNLEEFKKSIQSANMKIIKEVYTSSALKGPRIIICEIEKRGKK